MIGVVVASRREEKAFSSTENFRPITLDRVTGQRFDHIILRFETMQQLRNNFQLTADEIIGYLKTKVKPGGELVIL